MDDLKKNGGSSRSHQNGCSPKNCVQIIIFANWLLRHSSTSPKQQRHLCLLFCLYTSSIAFHYLTNNQDMFLGDTSLSWETNVATVIHYF